MNVANTKNHEQLILDIARSQSGTLLTSDLTEQNIPRSYLHKLVSEGVLDKVSRGVYVMTDAIEDVMFYLQRKYPQIIYSHETALFIHGLTDRTPAVYTATVPSGYKAVQNLSENCKLYYMKRAYHDLGQIEGETSFGNTIRLYDRERTICDLIRNRNTIDTHIRTEALKKFVVSPSANFMLLSDYARNLRVETPLHQYLEVLL